jgi:hypothetical protein
LIANFILAQDIDKSKQDRMDELTSLVQLELRIDQSLARLLQEKQFVTHKISNVHMRLTDLVRQEALNSIKARESRGQLEDCKGRTIEQIWETKTPKSISDDTLSTPYYLGDELMDSNNQFWQTLGFGNEVVAALEMTPHLVVDREKL